MPVFSVENLEEWSYQQKKIDHKSEVILEAARVSTIQILAAKVVVDTRSLTNILRIES